MSLLQAYIMFNGNCREALNFYNEAIGGEVKIMTFGESPMASQIPQNELNRVMHATLIKDDLVLNASDSMPGNEVSHGSTVSLSISCSEAEIDGLFDKLSIGGNITMPLQTTFWGARFGMFKDKYGFDWMLNADLK